MPESPREQHDTSTAVTRVITLLQTKVKAVAPRYKNDFSV